MHVLLLFTLGFILAIYHPTAKAAPWQPANGNVQIPLWPGTAPEGHKVNDPVDPVEYSTLYFAALKKAGVPVEMHLFGQGKHAFGLRPTEFPITRWPALVDQWLVTIGMN